MKFSKVLVKLENGDIAVREGWNGESCSSLSHFAVLQSYDMNVLQLGCCSSLSHFAVLQ